jgi:effector-binding domain-containing protein
MIIFYIVLAVFVLWSVWGLLSSNVEQAKYKIVKKAKDYEIRKYPEHIVAQTTVKGAYDEALYKGFSNVAGYIFGGNVKKESIPMTAPVTERRNLSERIAMTAPVMEKKEGESHVIAFVMPSSYTIHSLPKPLNSEVKIVSVPEKRFAVIRFTWYRSEKRIKKFSQKLLAALTRDGVAHKGNPVYAGYNAPWTPPWLVRNEVMIEIIK